MKIKRTVPIFLAVIGLYFGLYFAVMDWDIPVSKGGRFVNTCAFRWASYNTVVDGGRGGMAYGRRWHPLNVVFAPAEDIVNALRGRSSAEMLRSLNRYFEQ
jgi:hypothetical protein